MNKMKWFGKRKNIIDKFVMIVDKTLIPTSKDITCSNDKWEIIRQDRYKYIWSLNKGTNSGLRHDRNTYVSEMSAALENSEYKKLFVVMDLLNIGEAEEAILSTLDNFKDVSIYYYDDNYLKAYYLNNRFEDRKLHPVKYEDTMKDVLRMLNIHAN